MAYKYGMSLRECMEDEEVRPEQGIYWGFLLGLGLVVGIAILFFASCEILPSANSPESFGFGPMSIQYVHHRTTVARGVVDVSITGFTQGAYRLWVQTGSLSQINSPGQWFVPSGDSTPIEVRFSRDKSGATDTVTIMVENDFDETASEYSRATIEVSYQ